MITGTISVPVQVSGDVQASVQVSGDVTIPNAVLPPAYDGSYHIEEEET